MLVSYSFFTQLRRCGSSHVMKYQILQFSFFLQRKVRIPFWDRVKCLTEKLSKAENTRRGEKNLGQARKWDM